MDRSNIGDAAPAGETLPAMVRAHAAFRGERLALRFLHRGEEIGDEASYAALDVAARIVAGNLIASGLKRGPFLLALPQGLDFVRVFLGCLYAGVIVVPAPALGDPRAAERIASIVENAKPIAVIGTADAADNGRTWQALRERLSSISYIGADALLAGEPATGLVDPSPGDIAFLQYTSGSTSRPKGVVITHRNLTANLAMIRQAFRQTDDHRTVSWLPLHHDMGLIGCALEPLSLGAQSVIMSPLAFLQRPARWLQALHRFEATTAGAPNFAYDLCARAVTDEQMRGVDLSAWRLAFCGSEPIRAPTLARFSKRFSPYGFASEALYACYGLAEATLFVTGGSPGTGVRERALPGSAGSQGAVAVSCGTAALGSDVALLATDGPDRVASGAIGEIAVHGDHVSPGFWDPRRGIVADTERTALLDGRRYLRTGDLGAFADGALHVVGRLKNMIIVHGLNIYTEDIENTVMNASTGHAIGTVVALPVSTEETGGSENIVLLCETAALGKPDPAFLERLAVEVAHAHGIAPVELLLVAPGSIKRTVSGKLQRVRTAEHLRQGGITVLDRFVPRAAHSAKRAAEPEAGKPLEDAAIGMPGGSGTEGEAGHGLDSGSGRVATGRAAERRS